MYFDLLELENAESSSLKSEEEEDARLLEVRSNENLIVSTSEADGHVAEMPCADSNTMKIPVKECPDDSHSEAEEESGTEEDLEPKEEDEAEGEEEEEENSITRRRTSRKRKVQSDKKDAVESKSKMAAFLPARQLWAWSGSGYRRPGAKGKSKKKFFKAITRGEEVINVGDSAVFLSTSVPERPYIGTIESMWETTNSNMVVRVKWYYHPEETQGCGEMKYPGALFDSPHLDENDVQTISHKCDVLPLQRFKEILNQQPHRYNTIYENNDLYYLAGHYDPTNFLIKFEPGVV